ncbi:hypothetical protein [Gloeothece verrucosa]|uniref:Uncharacterized protein n=1 Tax=Gloeothece verrucosa (strain PCC 7822) TaxID=497965 RepID=E0ULC8_GLOV7|nr:hypothetical protein [Gloeothece verrucosa]ADN17758.1 hypothetical protein Cyan7822_5904 [Gloeothece verrucosa PCC 7822]
MNSNISENSLILRQFFHKESCTYTYLIAENCSKLAMLINPVLEQVECYLQIIKELGLTLNCCLETNSNENHQSGIYYLQNLTQCQIIVLNVIPKALIPETETIDPLVYCGMYI